MSTALAQSPRPMERESARYRQMLLDGKFDEIERAAEDARKTGAAISDGQPRLAAIYAGLSSDCVNGGCRIVPPEGWPRLEGKLAEWRRKSPASVTAEIASAAILISEAWYIRGGGYAGTVAPDAMQGFKSGIAKAATRFESMSPQSKSDPGWYAGMLDIGLASGMPAQRFYTLYTEAVGKYPTYLPIYFTASAYIAPRWNGSPEQFRTFVEYAVNATRAKLGDTLYARLNWSLWTNSMFMDGQTDWPRMKAGFERMTADYPDAWNINNYARFACQAGDFPALLEIDKKINGKPIAAAWMGEPAIYQQCMLGAKDFAAHKK